MIMRRSVALILSILLTAGAMAGCFGQGQVNEEPVAPLRSPYPTFTPTPAQPAPPTPEAPPAALAAETAPQVVVIDGDAAASPAEVAAEAAAPAAAAPSVLAVVNDDLINIRGGPGQQYPPLRLGMRGDQFTITGRSADDEWWQICCVEERSAWISQSYIDADGPVDGVPVVDPDADTGDVVVINPTPTPAPPAPQAPAPAAPVAEVPAVEAPAAEVPAESPPPAEPPAPTLPFALIAQEQFPENNNLVRIFLYVYQGETVLPGYSLRVSKDGAELPVSAVSADVSGLTWPTASPRQRFHNMKVEFPNMNPGGTWTIELIDGGGAVVGPVATFTMAAGDTNRELYVRYEKQ